MKPVTNSFLQLGNNKVGRNKKKHEDKDWLSGREGTCTHVHLRTYLFEVKEEVAGAAYTRLLGTDLAARRLELHRTDQLATPVTLVTTGILRVKGVRHQGIPWREH